MTVSGSGGVRGDQQDDGENSDGWEFAPPLDCACGDLSRWHRYLWLFGDGKTLGPTVFCDAAEEGFHGGEVS